MIFLVLLRRPFEGKFLSADCFADLITASLNNDVVYGHNQSISQFHSLVFAQLLLLVQKKC